MSNVSRLAMEMVSAGYEGVQVLEDVSVEVSSGEIVAVLGPNGSGKSTLIKTFMGLTSLFGGKISWNDQDITRLPVHLRAFLGLAYVPQVDSVFPALSVLENLSMGAYLMPKRSIHGELERVLDLFPLLKERLGVRASSISGGEGKMLSLAAALMMRPRCLLLDEPTSDLAPVAIEAMFEKVRMVRNEYRMPLLLVQQNILRAL